MQNANKTPPELHTDPKAELLHATDPVCAMSVDPSHAAGSVAHDGQTYYFCSKSCQQKFQADPKQYLKPNITEQGIMSRKAKDPVCGMMIDRARSAATATHDGKTVYFCSTGCHQIFLANPAKFATDTPQSSVPPPWTGGTIYTCPMHPEVRQDHPGTCPKCGMSLEPVGAAPAATKVEYSCPMHPQIVRDQPGSCPICGMALEPRTVELDAGPSREQTDMPRRFHDVGIRISRIRMCRNKSFRNSSLRRRSGFMWVRSSSSMAATIREDMTCVRIKSTCFCAMRLLRAGIGEIDHESVGCERPRAQAARRHPAIDGFFLLLLADRLRLASESKHSSGPCEQLVESERILALYKTTILPAARENVKDWSNGIRHWQDAVLEPDRSSTQSGESPRSELRGDGRLLPAVSHA